MGLLDNVIGALAQPGSGGGGNDPMQALMGLLNQHGGLGGLLQQLQQGGLAGAVQSWIGSGSNQPVSPDALGQVLNADAVSGFARQLGVDPQEALGHLSQMLPQVVDHLTPQGQLPAGGLDGLGALLGGGGAGGGAAGGVDRGGVLGGRLGKR